MCDFSLESYGSRKAEQGDRLLVFRFPTGTTGVCRPHEHNCPTCLEPGTELAFDGPIELWDGLKLPPGTATFIQFECNAWMRNGKPLHHRDGLEMADGKRVLLQNLKPGQTLSVLQVPAEPDADAIWAALMAANTRPADYGVTKRLSRQLALANARR